MGHVNAHPPVKYFCAITFAPDVNLEEIEEVLERRFSGIERKSKEFDFSVFTEYYAEEMGDRLKKVIVVFTRLMPPELLADLKHKSNEIEQNWMVDGRRQVNLDPGYVSDAKMVLATTKNYNHRLYLGKGIFGDIHLNFTNKSFQPQTWTYPDYAQEEVIGFFNTVRSNYFHQLGEHLSP